MQAVVANQGLNLTAEWRMLKACLHLIVDETDSLSKFEIEFFTRTDQAMDIIIGERIAFLEEAIKKKNN